MSFKMSTNTSNKEVITKEPSAFIFGDDVWKLITKYTNEDKGIMKSTKAMQVGDDVVIQVSTQIRNIDNTFVVAEALTTIQNMCIIDVTDSSGNVISRALKPLKYPRKF